MYNIDLKNIGISNYETLKNKPKKPDLLIGNGFSMSLSRRFSYSSLFKTFLAKTKDPFTKLFADFGTTNFEQILKYLTYALKVNTLLNLDTVLINEAIKALKNGLIEAIKEIHPRADELDKTRLYAISRQLKDFGNIYSTNYDLYFYHIIMNSLELRDIDKTYTAYQDFFWGRPDVHDGQKYRQFMGYQGQAYKSVLYLHGSLFIYEEGAYDLKIIRQGDEELIDVISHEIEQGKFPLFVTEGRHQDKTESINRSRYLTFSMNHFGKASTPLVIYGNSLSEYDGHILTALHKTKRPLVIGIYTNGRSLADLDQERMAFLSKFNDYKQTIDFVDSSTIFQ